MPKNIKLMLTENVESLGIVGDVVNVRVGYARNFLLPRSMATTPTDEAIAAVATKRAEAQRLLAEQRKHREEVVEKLEGIHLTMVRSCNDLGHLYASVTQQEIAAALAAEGYQGIRPRDVRLNVNIKRVDTYDVPIKFEADLEAHIKLTVQPDRKLDLRHHEATPVEPNAEGEAGAPGAGGAGGAAGAEAGIAIEAAPEKGKKKKDRAEKDAGERPAKADRGDKGEKADKAGGGEAGEKPAKGEKKPKKEKGEGGKGEAKGEGGGGDKKSSGGWGTPVSKPEGLDFLGQKRERRRR
jgi:large subunit ribosomal protein L9